MKKKEAALIVEAIILGGPTTALAVYGLPWLFTMAIVSAVEHPATGAIGLICLLGTAWALAEFWRLALATVLKHSYGFGSRYWLAVLGAIGAMVGLWGTGPSWFVAALVLPTAICAAHFSMLQIRVGTDRQANGPASGGHAA